MVKPSEITTYANWDLVSGRPRPRRFERVLAGGTETPGNLRMQSARWPRGARTWTTTIRLATHRDLARYTQIWIDTRNGVLPVSFTPPPPEDSEGALPVLIDQQQFGVVIANAVVGSFDVDVTEFF